MAQRQTAQHIPATPRLSTRGRPQFSLLLARALCDAVRCCAMICRVQCNAGCRRASQQGEGS
eukprot:2566024-Rhodomonas_salina.1